jgi:hypothetical protein
MRTRFPFRWNIEKYARSYLRFSKETWFGQQVCARQSQGIGIATAKVPSSSLDKITAEYLEEQLRPLAKFVEPAAPAEVPAVSGSPCSGDSASSRSCSSSTAEVSAPAAPAIAAADIPVEVVTEARPEVPTAANPPNRSQKRPLPRQLRLRIRRRRSARTRSRAADPSCASCSPSTSHTATSTSRRESWIHSASPKARAENRR